jgi:hypothetical protein
MSTYEKLYHFDSRIYSLLLISFHKLQYVLETIEKQKSDIKFTASEVIE